MPNYSARPGLAEYNSLIYYKLMPSKNSRKTYVPNGFYHIYNRGVEKRNIFEDKQDYSVFLSYLKVYLTPKDIDKLQNKLSDPKVPWLEKDKVIKQLRLNNFFDEIKLLAYCLMPNHFHLLLNQKSADGIDRLMNSLNTRYVGYFNKKYKRIGPLYQGVYKAVLVKTDEQLTHLSAYIHRNPAQSLSSKDLQNRAIQILTKQPSSLPEYLGQRKTSWIICKNMLKFFSYSNKLTSYKHFVINYIHKSHLIRKSAID